MLRATQSFSLSNIFSLYIFSIQYILVQQLNTELEPQRLIMQALCCTDGETKLRQEIHLAEIIKRPYPFPSSLGTLRRGQVSGRSPDD